MGDGIKVNHEQILHLRDILKDEICEPLDKAAESAEEGINSIGIGLADLLGDRGAEEPAKMAGEGLGKWLED